MCGNIKLFQRQARRQEKGASRAYDLCARVDEAEEREREKARERGTKIAFDSRV